MNFKYNSALVVVLMFTLLMLTRSLIPGFLGVITGKFILSSSSHTQTLNLTFEENQTYNWTLSEDCFGVNCSLNSIKASGSIVANASGYARIYVENFGKKYLILDESFELSTTTTTTFTTSSTTTTMNETNTSETATNQTTMNTTEEIINETTNQTIIEPEVFYFVESCVDTCEITDTLNESSYELIFELSTGVMITLDSVKYTWNWFEIETTTTTLEATTTTTLNETTTTTIPLNETTTSTIPVSTTSTSTTSTTILETTTTTITTTTTTIPVELRVKFDRNLECHRCGKQKAPPLTDVNMTISASVSNPVENANLTDYYPNDWIVVDSNGGIVGVYNSSYNKIEWDVENVTGSVSRWYMIRSPQITIPPTKYYFQTELSDQKSDWWFVIVTDDPVAYIASLKIFDTHESSNRSTHTQVGKGFQSQYNYDTYSGIKGNNTLAQSFKFSSNVTLLRVETGVEHDGTPQDNLTLEIRKDNSSGYPDMTAGGLLTSMNKTKNDIPSVLGQWRVVWDITDIKLASNTSYWILLKSPNTTGSNVYNWYRNSNSDAYTDGQAKTSSNLGESWSTINYDFEFKAFSYLGYQSRKNLQFGEANSFFSLWGPLIADDSTVYRAVLQITTGVQEWKWAPDGLDDAWIKNITSGVRFLKEGDTPTSAKEFIVTADYVLTNGTDTEDIIVYPASSGERYGNETPPYSSGAAEYGQVPTSGIGAQTIQPVDGSYDWDDVEDTIPGDHWIYIEYWFKVEDTFSDTDEPQIEFHTLGEGGHPNLQALRWTFGIKNPPDYSNIGVNNSAPKPNEWVKHYTEWSDDTGLSGYVFSSNYTGSWGNETWQSMTGTGNWSNVTKQMPSTPGYYAWRIYANDTSDNWNVIPIQSIVVANRWLEVNLTEPNSTYQDLSNPLEVIQYSIFNVNATVKCKTDLSGLSCGSISGSIRYNDTGTEPNQLINVTGGAIPFYISSSYGPGFVTVIQSESKFKTGSDVYSSPAIADVDNDGTLEIVIGSVDDYVYVLNHTNGVLKNESKFKTGGDVYSSPAIADVDNDGTLEIVIGSVDDYVYVLNHTNGVLKNESKFKTGGDVLSSPAIADVDNDGTLEIVIGSYDEYVYVLNHTNGVLKNESRYKTGASLFSSPAIADVDNDGTLEIVIGSWDDYVYVLNASSYSGYEWQNWTMFHHDLNHTGYQVPVGVRNAQSCGSLTNNQQCQLNWTINATGNVNDVYVIDVNFSSNPSNDTEDAYVKITGGPSGPYLEVDWATGSQINATDCQAGSPCEFDQYTTFTANATVTCNGGDCGSVSGNIRYNDTGTEPNQTINTTEGATPFYIVDGEVTTKAYWRPINWTKSGTGDVNNPENASDYRYNNTNTRVYVFASKGVTPENVQLVYTYDLPDGTTSGVLFMTTMTPSTGEDGGVVNIYNFTKGDYDSWFYESGDDTIRTRSLPINTTLGYINSTGGVKIEVDLSATQFTSDLLYVYDTYITTSGNTYDYWGINTGNSATLMNATYRDAPTSCDVAWCPDSSEFSNSGYGNISQSNDTYFEMDATQAYPRQTYHIKINESVSNVNAISIRWEGYPNAIVGSVTLNIWNSTDWKSLGTYSTTSDDDIGLYYELNTSISNYIDSDSYLHLKLLGAPGDVSGKLYTDYIKVNVITEEKNTQSCGSLTDGQSCQLNWTINTTGNVNDVYVIDVNFSTNPSNDTEDAYVKITESCSDPYEDMDINSDITLCPGTFYLNDTNDNGVIRANAHNIVIKCDGTILDGNDGHDSIGIYVNGFDNVTVKNCTTKDYYEGITFNNAENGIIINNTATSSDDGFCVYSSSNITVTGNHLHDNDVGGIFLYNGASENLIENNVLESNVAGIYLKGSTVIKNTIKNNTIKSNLWGVYFESSANNNTLFNNSIYNNNEIGIVLYGSSFNTFQGDSIYGNPDADIYLESASSTNNFRNINFTEPRLIYFYDTNSWFNYNNETTGNIWLKTKVSVADTNISRKLINWDQSLMRWNDTSWSPVTARYNITGLKTSTTYNIYNNSVLTYTNTTDVNGVLPSFTIYLSSEHEIKVEEDVEAPKWSDNTTNNTVAGRPTEFRLKWTDAALSGYIFSLDNCTNSFSNVTEGSLSGTEDWSNVSLVINDTEGCTIRWQVFANDTNDNCNVSDVFSFTTLPTYCDYSIQEWELPYTITQNNSYYCLASDEYIGGQTAITFNNPTQNTTLDCLNYNLWSDDAINTYGVVCYGTNTKNDTIKNCYVSDFDYGVNLGADNNILINNTFISNLYYGFYLNNANNNQLINNTAMSNIRGIYIQSGSNNNITGGSSHDNSLSDYRLDDAGATNYFRNTNFTAARKISFYSETISWFNYNNRTDIELWLKTNVTSQSTIPTIERELTSWNQSLMQWNDTNSSGSEITARYNITGLKTNRYYSIYNNSVFVQSLQTDPSGMLPSFTIYLSSEHEIKVEEDLEAPKWSDNTTNNTVAGRPIEFRLKWTNAALSGYVFSLDNCTNSFSNVTEGSLSGTVDWSNVSLVINDTEGCTIRWQVFANDTNDNWNVSDVFSFITLPTYCDYSIQEWELPYTITQNNKYYCLASDEYIGGQTAIMFNNPTQNTTLDCLNYNLKSNDTSNTYGVYLTGSNTKNNTVKNCNITDFYYGIYLDSGPNNNTLTNNTANSNSNIGIYLYSSSSNTLTRNTINSSSTGIYLYYNSDSNTISNNNITTYGGNNDGILLESLSNSIVSNNTITIYGSSSIGIYLISVELPCSYNIISNNNITTSGSSGCGVYLEESDSNNITNNNITTSGSSGYGVEVYYYSDSNTISNNNITTSGSSGYGVVLSSSDSNTLYNNRISTSGDLGYGIYLSFSSTNNITGGSIISKLSYDYYLEIAGTTNNFTNTNFTAARTIYFDDTTSWFNYNNESSENIWLKTKVSSAANITRELTSWTQSLIQWNDTNTSGSDITVRYNIIGLKTSTTYNIYNNSVLTYTNTTDVNGVLPSFTIYLSSEHEIKVEEDTEAPKWSDNTTNNTVAGRSTEFRLKWTNADLSGYIFSLDNCTGSLENITEATLSGTEDWSNRTFIINSTEGCKIRWQVFANDTNDNWNTSDIFSFITLPTYCDYSIQEWELPYTITQNNKYYCLAEDSYFNGIADQYTIKFPPGVQDSTLDCLNYNLNGNDIDRGIRLDGSNNTIRNCNITNFDHGVFVASGPNKIINNTFSSNHYAIRGNSHNNEIINNTITSNTIGIELYGGAGSNNIIGGCISSNNDHDIRLEDTNPSNYFRNTDFTDSRKIYLKSYSSVDWFIYNDRIDIELWLKTKVSTLYETIERKLINWNNTLMQWNDTPDSTLTVTYNITGLKANRSYTIYNNSVFVQSLQTDSSGVLPSFTIYLSSEHEIKVEEDLEAPKWSDNSTNNTVAGRPTEFRLKWTNAALSGYVFSLDNCTNSFSNVTEGSLSGTEDWSNVTHVINETEGCTIRWKVYANDTNDNWNVSDVFSFITLPTYCDYSIQEWELPYTMSQSNKYYCLASDGYIADQTAIGSTSNLQNSTLDCLGYNLDSNDIGSSSNGVSLTGTNTKNNTVKNCNITDFYDGIELSQSSNNTIINNIANSNSYGLSIGLSDNNNITNNTFNSNFDNGIDINLCSNNIITNNIVIGNSRGIRSNSAPNNNITGGSIHSSGTADYYAYSSITPYFRNTNFSATREIEFRYTTSWFNYNNRTDIELWLITKTSSEDANIKRKLVNWTQSSMIWNDTNDDVFALTMTYNITGLNVDKYYNVYNNSDLTYTLQTGSSGKLPAFTIYLPGSQTREIKVEEDVEAPKWSDNSTNNTVAGKPTEFRLKWTNAALSGYIFSLDNCTGSLSNLTASEILEKTEWSGGTEEWSNVTVRINSSVGCTIRWCVYANDTNDNWNGTSCDDPFTFTTTDEPPQWSNLTVSPASGVTYSPGQSYQFNITWIDDIGLSEVILEFNGINYTNNSGDLSKDGNVYYKTFDDLPAGSFSYVWYANDTNDNWNSSWNTRTFYVGGDYDDAEEKGNGNFYLSSFTWSVWSNIDSSSFYYECSGFRFPNVDIPQDSTISDTKLKLYLHYIYEDDMNCDIYGNDVDDSSDFNDNQNIINTTERPRTSTSVSWIQNSLGIGWKEKGGLEGIVEEIVGRPGWNSGNALALLLIAKTDTTKECVGYTYNEGSEYAAQLEVTYSQVYVINKAPTAMNLYLNDTDDDRVYHSNESVNITADLNMSFDVEIWTNFTGSYDKWDSGPDPLMNHTDMDYGLGPFNVTGNFSGNQNYSASYDSHLLTVWGWSNLSWVSPDDGDYVIGNIITLNCSVLDANTSSPIQDYLVKFYNETDTASSLLGTNLTDSSGHAIYRWNTSDVAEGTYYPKCNITDNSTLYYNVSVGEDNTTITFSPNQAPNIWNLVVRNFYNDNPITETATGVWINITVNISDSDNNLDYVETNFTWPNGTIVYSNLTLIQGKNYTHVWNYSLPYEMPNGTAIINVTAYDTFAYANTTNTTLTILENIEIVLENTPVNFSSVNPGTETQAVQYQGWPLNISVLGNVPVNISQTGEDMIGKTIPSVNIKVGNITWNQSSTGLFSQMTTTYTLVNTSKKHGDYQYIYYKLNVPVVEPQPYGGDLIIKGEQT